MTAFHHLDVAECLAATQSASVGLTSAEASRRLVELGPNRLPEARVRGPMRRFFEQFNNVLIYVLLGALLHKSREGFMS
jgi:magnesium-transporting ATPase (P-type)